MNICLKFAQWAQVEVSISVIINSVHLNWRVYTIIFYGLSRWTSYCLGHQQRRGFKLLNREHLVTEQRWGTRTESPAGSRDRVQFRPWQPHSHPAVSNGQLVSQQNHSCYFFLSQNAHAASDALYRLLFPHTTHRFERTHTQGDANSATHRDDSSLNDSWLWNCTHLLTAIMFAP